MTPLQESFAVLGICVVCFFIGRFVSHLLPLGEAVPMFIAGFTYESIRARHFKRFS